VHGVNDAVGAARILTSSRGGHACALWQPVPVYGRSAAVTLLVVYVCWDRSRTVDRPTCVRSDFRDGTLTPGGGDGGGSADVKNERPPFFFFLLLSCTFSLLPYMHNIEHDMIILFIIFVNLAA